VFANLFRRLQRNTKTWRTPHGIKRKNHRQCLLSNPERLEHRVLFSITPQIPVAAAVSSAHADIINGQPTLGNFPSVGEVTGPGFLASGTLISPDLVLTAAHVTPAQGVTPTEFEIDGQPYSVVASIPFPGYVPGEHNIGDSKNDIAILKLSEPVQGVVPSPLDTTAPTSGEAIYIVGFGGNSTTPNSGLGTERFGVNTIGNVESYTFSWSFVPGGALAGTEPGDSGGPAFVWANNSFEIAGVTSGGNSVSSSTDTRVDAYLSWIEQAELSEVANDPNVQWCSGSPSGLGYFALYKDGTLKEWTPQGGLATISNNVASAKVENNNTGSIVFQTMTGALYRVSPGGGPTTISGGDVQFYAEDGQGETFYLEDGVLFSSSPASSTPRKIDAAVQSFAIAPVPNDILYDLEENGNLYYMRPSGALTLMDTNVQSIDIDGAGTLYELKSNGALSSSTWNAGWHQIDSGVRSFVLSSDGSLFDLERSGNLDYMRPGGALTLMDHYVQSIAVDQAGTLYDLESNGVLSSHTWAAGWHQIDSGVQSFILSSDGSIFDLERNGNLDYMRPGGALTPMDSTVQSIAVDQAGTLYDLESNGLLSSHTWAAGWQQIDSGVQSFVLSSDGSIFDLERNAKLFYMRPGGTLTPMDSTVQSIAVDQAGTLYDLESNGLLYSRTWAAGWHQIDSGVQSFILSSDGSVFDLERNAKLFYMRPGGTLTPMDTTVQSIAVDQSGTLYDLESNGVLSSHTWAVGWNTIDRGAQSFILSSDGSIFDLERSGNLYYMRPGGALTLMDRTVQSIAVGADGTLYDLESSGLLSSHTWAAGWNNLDQNVQSISLANGGDTLNAQKQGGVIRQFVG